MAHLYDYLHDGTRLHWLSRCLPSWVVSGLFLMDIQLILSIIIGLGACFYILKKISRQFHQPDKDPLCEECDISQEQDIREKE